eukprot:1150272-Pelagomonas_calceolata.AAC.1
MLGPGPPGQLLSNSTEVEGEVAGYSKQGYGGYFYTDFDRASMTLAPVHAEQHSSKLAKDVGSFVLHAGRHCSYSGGKWPIQMFDLAEGCSEDLGCSKCSFSLLPPIGS